MNRYLELWRSGQLARAAQGCRTASELAARIGVSVDGLYSGLKRLRRSHPDAPLVDDLVNKGGVFAATSRDRYAHRNADITTEIGDATKFVGSPQHGPEPMDTQIGHSSTQFGEWDEPTNPGTPAGLSHELGHTLAPDGFHVQGVSTYYDENGVPVRQWVKTAADKDRAFRLLKKAMENFAEPFTGIFDPVAAPAYSDDDLLCVYPFGDPHLGMYAWAEETGDDFDLKIAERDMVAAVDALVSVAPPAKTAILVTVGDTFHADGKGNATTGGTPQDIDTRWSKVFSVVQRSFRRSIDRALEKHERVIVYIVSGNHDEVMSLVLAHCLAGFYERDPRVEVCTSPGAFHWYRFGKCLLGFAHGDKTKTADMPLIMACDRKEDWAATEFRQVYSGHLHHEIVKEYPGVTVRTLRTLAPKDKYHASHGYRSGQDMKCDVWHREWGQIMQHSIGIAQVRKKAA